MHFSDLPELPDITDYLREIESPPKEGDRRNSYDLPCSSNSKQPTPPPSIAGEWISPAVHLQLAQQQPMQHQVVVHHTFAPLPMSTLAYSEQSGRANESMDGPCYSNTNNVNNTSDLSGNAEMRMPGMVQPIPMPIAAFPAPTKRVNGCPEKCRVCDEQATGYHYDAMSCNGCKTFFRRSVMDKREYACKTGGKCFEVLPREKRLSCRSCRFERCVDAGMNPLTFQTKEDVGGNPVTLRILAKRKGKEPVETETTEQSTVPCSSKMFVPIALEETLNRVIDELCYLEIKHDRIRKSCFNPQPADYNGIEEVVRRHSMMHNDFDEMRGWPLPMTDPDHVPIDIILSEKIPMPAKTNRPANAKFWMFADLIYSIEYAKALPLFSMLDEQDKIRLLKSSVILCMNLTTTYYSYTHKSDVNLHPDGTSPTRARNYPGFIGAVDQYMCRIIASLIRMNIRKEEYVLLKAILLCNEACEDLSPYALNLLKKERERLVKSLVSFCLATRGPVHGPQTVSAVLGIADTIAHQVKTQKEQFVLAGICGLRPHKNPLLEAFMDSPF